MSKFIIFILVCVGVIILGIVIWYLKYYNQNYDTKTIPSTFEEDFTDQEFNIFVINLDRSKDRLESIKKILKNNGFTFERIKGIDCKDYKSVDEMRKKIPKTPLCIYQPGQIGCFMSHLKALQKAINSNKYWSLILDDDIDIVDKDFKNKLTKFLNENNDKDIIFVQGKPRDEAWQAKHGESRPIYKNNCPAWGCDAYFVNKDSAKKIYDFIYKIIPKKGYDSCPIDWLICPAVLSEHGFKIICKPFFTDSTFTFASTRS